MKQILVIVLILTSLFGLCLVNGAVVGVKTDGMIERIHQCEALAGFGALEEARGPLLEAMDRWTANELYFCTVLRHSETDEIAIALHTALGALESGDTDSFLCLCCRLRTCLQLIRETEELTLSNIL